ncbi:hypothetical protein AOXY_G36961 [Acipenser oxyrinchus oxyrinchus]|uniref:Uncharacterized protein n=1 Tax=Acipenser oxyrinchus oxyrinchus TaxID=40147 RepID=A0AAD8CF15_ACIOX|nr:hypothetical protein AOXY_G36961 [Acipenser oxyrinchus oxyrinchus]
MPVVLQCFTHRSHFWWGLATLSVLWGRSSPAGSNCHLPEESTHFSVLEQCYSGNPVCTELSRSAQGTEFKWHSSITEVGEMTSGVQLHSCSIEDV